MRSPLFDAFVLLLTINSHCASRQPGRIMHHYHLWGKLWLPGILFVSYLRTIQISASLRVAGRREVRIGRYEVMMKVQRIRKLDMSFQVENKYVKCII